MTRATGCIAQQPKMFTASWHLTILFCRPNKLVWLCETKLGSMCICVCVGLQLYLTFALCILALKDEIAAANEKFMSAYKSQDANAVAAMYTEDCKIMPPGSDVVMGRDGTVCVCLCVCVCMCMHAYM